MNTQPKSPEAERATKFSALVFFCIYLVQKFTNHFEGFSRLPVRKILKDPLSEGGFGLGTEEAGAFLTNSALGWYVKALMGFVTDTIPICGYRRKSWLILSLTGSGLAWLYVAATGTSSSQALFAGLVIVNILVAFSDVVADGLMVQTGQELERRFGLPEGTGNRPLQTAQWIGAFTAILFAAIAGGVIAQLFDVTVAALLSAFLPIALAVGIFFFVTEEKVEFEWSKAKVGFKAIIVIIVVAVFILWLKGLGGDDAANWENNIASGEWIISPLVILGAILSLYRPPMRLVWPTLLIFFWKFNPFAADGQWIYQYFTKDNKAFLSTLENDTILVPFLRDVVVTLKLAKPEVIAESGFQEIFFGSVLDPIGAVFAILGLVIFFKYWRSTPLTKVFSWAITGLVVTTGLYLLIPLFGISSPYYLLLCACFAGFTGALGTISTLTYAAGVCPAENQATSFAFLMGMSNLGMTLGVERMGTKLYTVFGSQAEIEGVMVIQSPHQGMLWIGVIGLVMLGGLFVFVRWLGRNGHLSNEEIEAE